MVSQMPCWSFVLLIMYITEHLEQHCIWSAMFSYRFSQVLRLAVCPSEVCICSDCVCIQHYSNIYFAHFHLLRQILIRSKVKEFSVVTPHLLNVIWHTVLFLLMDINGHLNLQMEQQRKHTV